MSESNLICFKLTYFFKKLSMQASELHLGQLDGLGSRTFGCAWPGEQEGSQRVAVLSQTCIAARHAFVDIITYASAIPAQARMSCTSGVRTYPAFGVVTPACGAARRARQHDRGAERVHLGMEGLRAPAVALRVIRQPVLRPRPLVSDEQLLPCQVDTAASSQQRACVKVSNIRHQFCRAF